MHNPNPLETSIVGSGNESARSFLKGKFVLGLCVDKFGFSKFQIALMPFDKLGIESTTTNPTPQLQSVEGEDWVVLQPRLSPSKKLFTKKGQATLKSPSSSSVVEGETSQVVGWVNKLPTTF
jgi:hypothetical protein